MKKSKSFEKYFQSIKFLEGFFNLRGTTKQYGRAKNPEIYIQRMKHFLKLLGNPDRGFKFIHITGTSGKGSVANILHSILVASGERAGLFTSPFVTSSIEKIKVGKFFISPNEFAEIVEEIKPAINQAFADGLGPSYFEIFLASAFLYFKKKNCKWVVLEVGAGGRYDSTNVIKSPKVTVITNIDFDHVELLGKTLTKIASDKAGIIKRGSSFWTAESRPHLLKIFKNICQQKKVPFHQVKINSRYYQDLNLALVKSIAQSLKISDSVIEKGIKTTQALPCRFEKIQSHPLVILDGAHNRSKIRSTLENLKNLKYQKLFLIIGFAENKEIKDVLEPLIPYAQNIFATRFEVKERKCTNPVEILQAAKQYFNPERSRTDNKKLKTEIFFDPNQALVKALKLAKKNDLILVTGSFYLAGELRQRWYPEIKILQTRQIS